MTRGAVIGESCRVDGRREAHGPCAAPNRRRTQKWIAPKITQVAPTVSVCIVQAHFQGKIHCGNFTGVLRELLVCILPANFNTSWSADGLICFGYESCGVWFRCWVLGGAVGPGTPSGTSGHQWVPRYSNGFRPRQGRNRRLFGMPGPRVGGSTISPKTSFYASFDVFIVISKRGAMAPITL